MQLKVKSLKPKKDLSKSWPHALSTTKPPGPSPLIESCLMMAAVFTPLLIFAGVVLYLIKYFLS